ncbi:hypothetical protein J3R83DRAFT_13530 [Lanmaoa asiatica]|nr:hypothetical protein J3R83DRAFT_8932 [Lanmaoa asiatica]KAH0831028.1 hypothetical protein J3R83DRAFT_13530 [Lanmaoa asiatica]
MDGKFKLAWSRGLSMTIILLASVSLFALVVTSRPILSDSDLSDFAPASSALQTAVQVAFQIHPGEDDLELDATRFKSQKPKQQIEYLSELDAENIAVTAPVKILPGVKPSFEAHLDENARQDVLDTNKELDDSQADHIADVSITSEPVVDKQQEAPTDEIPTTPLVVLAFSCVAAFLALACIALTLYIIRSLRFQMLASKTAWDLLPRFWRRPGSSVPQEHTSVTAKDHLLGGACLLLQTEIGQQRLLDVEVGSAEKHDLHMEDNFDAVSDMESEWDDVDEKYQDALDMTPLPLTHDLPLEEHVSHQSHSGNPPLPRLGSYPLDQLTDDRSIPLMRELGSSRPAWSVRAIHSPVLGLSSREGGCDNSTPQPLIHPPRHAYRAAVPEFDIALAMQLRPGLGIGADSAWMVRFLMAIFGWFAVALTGNAR